MRVYLFFQIQSAEAIESLLACYEGILAHSRSFTSAADAAGEVRKRSTAHMLARKLVCAAFDSSADTAREVSRSKIVQARTLVQSCVILRSNMHIQHTLTVSRV